MGYYSSFEVIDTDIPNVLDVLNEYTETRWGGAPGWEFWSDVVHSYDSTKWYDWVQDLAILASDYPENFLIMERCGEESPDISRTVVRNGTAVEIEPELVWPEA